jgi:hypothetical protein
MQREVREYRVALTRNIFWVGFRRIIGYEKFRRNKYNGVKIGNSNEANMQIREGLISDAPFMAARFGDAELRTIVYTIENQLGLRVGFPEKISNIMHLNAGFFPPQPKYLKKYGELMIDCCGEVDVIGVWYNLLEDYILKKYAPMAHCVEGDSLAPYLSQNPWSAALKGKKVLVIHPFEESIQQQYERRVFLFNNEKILPDFDLQTLKAVQTAAGEVSDFSDWFEALNSMYQEALSRDFEVAIIGCGAYGFPLAAMLKRAGKKVVHLGGATQILFGIIGSRWERKPETAKLINEYWVRPLEIERPQNAKKVEGGCYW